MTHRAYNRSNASVRLPCTYLRFALNPAGVYVGLDTQTGIENSKINFPTYSLSRQEIFDRLIDPVGTISAQLKFMQIGLHVDVDRQVGLHSMLSSVALA